MAAADISQYLYPLDITGAAATNKVVGEKQTLNPPPLPEDNDGEINFHFVIPFATPYFRDSMKLKHVASGRTLVRGTDWTPGHKFISASKETEYVKGGIYGSILFYDSTLAGQIEFVEYQTLGSTWTLDDNHILELMTNRVVDPRSVSYEVIADKPEAFPPIDHNHPIIDTIGYSELVASNYDIAAAIRERTSDWLEHPPLLLSNYFTKDEMTVRELEQRELTLKQSDAQLLQLPWPDVKTTAGAETVGATGTAVPGVGGRVNIPASVYVQLGQLISPGVGRTRLFTTTAWSSVNLDVNSTYYLRGQVNSSGNLFIYVQKGADNDARPASLVGNPNLSNGGGFDTTKLDVLFAKVTTGAAGSVPTVLNLANSKMLVKEVSSTGAASVDASQGAKYDAPFTLNWARTPSMLNEVYAAVGQTSGAVYVDGGANYVRSITGNRYAITVSVTTNFHATPSVPTGWVTGRIWV